MAMELLEPRDAEARRAAGAELVDVRTPVEFAAGHAQGARNVPLDRLDPAALLKECGGRPLVLMCQAGTRSRAACEKLAAAGFADALQVAGGYAAWERAGLAVVRGQPAMSLERQVRIAAGALVVLGVALGFLVHPGCFGLAGFVGAGLVFAGVTDTCAMGLLIARMPWNQRGAAGAAR